MHFTTGGSGSVTGLHGGTAVVWSFVSIQCSSSYVHLSDSSFLMWFLLPYELELLLFHIKITALENPPNYLTVC